MYSTRSLFVSSLFVLFLFFLVSLYFGVIAPPPLITYTTDEHFIGGSGIFLLYGITPSNLEWAAIPSTIIAYLIFLFWCVFKLFLNISTVNTIGDALGIIDKNAFYYLNHREEFVIWERWVQLFIVSFILFQTVKFIINAKHHILSEGVKFILIFMCISSDVIWIYAPVIRPEALSGSLFIYIVYRLLFSEKITINSALFIVILFALTISQRLIFLFLTPFVLGSLMVYLKEEKYSWRDFLKYTTIFLAFLIALIPFLITDLLVVLKSFIGVAFAKLNHNSMGTYFNMDYISTFLMKPFNIFVSVLSILGIYYFHRNYNRRIILFLFLGNLFFILFNSLKSAQLYITHTYPLAIMFIVLIGFGLIYIISIFNLSKEKWAYWGIIFLMTINSFNEIHKKNNEIHAQQKNIADVILWVKSTNNNEKIALPLDFDGLLPKNQDCLLREYQANLSEKYRFEKLSKLLKIPVSDSISKFSLPIIAQSFAFEDEKFLDTKYQIELKYIESDSNKKFNTDYYFFKTDNMSHCILKTDALTGFSKGKYHYLVSDEKLVGLSPLKTFESVGSISFWVYENRNFVK
jgi:hypothetical protein